MIRLFETKSACFGCNACQAVCQMNAISMIPDTEGFLYPAIDTNRCVECGRCRQVCPANHPIEGLDGQAYALRCLDTDLLQKSASGGAFSLLAQAILGQDGLVCGAVFDENFRVQHTLTQDIAPMRKSKYVQSDLSGIHEAVREALAQGRKVLFTGTPCQCDSLRLFLGNPVEGLILAAILCRGVQSPGLWKDYVAHLAGDGKLEAYCFRDKRVRNDAHTVAYTVNGIEAALPMGKDALSRLYMKCLTLRPCCYQCPYTRWELPFDLTIGDFWGIEKFLPQLADGLGTSLVIARTDAGKALLEAVREVAILEESPRQAAFQPALLEPAKETLLRKLLFRDFARKDAHGHCDMALILKKYGG